MLFLKKLAVAHDSVSVSSNRPRRVQTTDQCVSRAVMPVLVRVYVCGWKFVAMRTSASEHGVYRLRGWSCKSVAGPVKPVALLKQRFISTQLPFLWCFAFSVCSPAASPPTACVFFALLLCALPLYLVRRLLPPPASVLYTYLSFLPRCCPHVFCPLYRRLLVSCPAALRPQFYANVLLTGGNCAIPNLRERLYRDLRASAPIHCEVNVILPEEPMLHAWRGV